MNTTTQYASKQREYLDWLKEEQYSDDLVTEDRVLVFLKAKVIGRQYRTKPSNKRCKLAPVI